MAEPWTADINVNEEIAAATIGSRFPHLAPLTIAPFGVGWDNAAFLVNDVFVFRFPRRRVAIPFLQEEIRLLPRIAPHVPLAVPVPEFVSDECDGFPHPFAGYRRISGVTACRIGWTDAERARLAAPLGEFLAALHGIPISAAVRAAEPGDVIARANVPGRALALRERLRSLPANVNVEPLLAAADRLAATPLLLAGNACWVHGDLYARHLLVDDARHLCAVIDWGDVHLGDPALDFSIAFSFLPMTARADFRRAYGPIDDATWDRARFRALHYGAILLQYGAAIGDSALIDAGAYALRNALL